MRLKLMLATLRPGCSPGSTRAHTLVSYFCGCGQTKFLHRKYNYSSAKSNAIVEVDHVVVDQTDAATRGARSNASRVIGAVNAIFGAADIYRTRAEWIARAARNHARQIGLAPDHLW